MICVVILTQTYKQPHAHANTNYSLNYSTWIYVSFMYDSCVGEKVIEVKNYDNYSDESTSLTLDPYNLCKQMDFVVY